MECPKCEKNMRRGYSSANRSLSWIKRSKFKSCVFTDDDLSEAGLSRLLPWKGYYFRAFQCEACEMLLVDYSDKLDRQAVEQEL